MYGMFSRFMTYRRFYVWRARYNYLVRSITGWTYVYAMLFLGLLYSCWIIWKISNPPVPQVHPEAAKVQVRMLSEQAFHRIAVAQKGDGVPGAAFSTPGAVRNAAQRSTRVREVYLGEEAKQLEAQMLADISDYIRVTGVCVPYLCWQVSETVSRLRASGQRTAQLDALVRPVLEAPEDAMPPLEGDLDRLQSSWSDAFQDVVFHGWVLNDVQVMHAQMMKRYPDRAPMPWMARLMDKPHDPLYGL